MSYTNENSGGFKRYVGAVALGIVSLAAAAYVTLKGPVTGLPPTGATVLRVVTGSGSQRAIVDDKGQAAFSGALKVQGVLINTGAVVTQGNADSRYVNTSGDTMTGALNVKANLSGSSLTINGTVRFGSGMIIASPVGKDIGWNVVSQANQACNTTCVNACVFGEDTSVLGNFVSCSDATADKCVCAGSN